MFAGIADVARWLSQTLCFVFVGSLSRSFNLCWMRFVQNFLCRCAGLFCNASEFWQITNHFSFNFASSTGFIRLFLFSSFIFRIKKCGKNIFERENNESHATNGLISRMQTTFHASSCMQVRQSQLEVINVLFTYFQWLQQRIICDLPNQLRVFWSFQWLGVLECKVSLNQWLIHWTKTVSRWKRHCFGFSLLHTCGWKMINIYSGDYPSSPSFLPVWWCYDDYFVNAIFDNVFVCVCGHCA